MAEIKEWKVCEEIYMYEVIGCLARKLEDDKLVDIELILDKLPKQQATFLKENLKYMLEWLP
ncbi:MAG: hypothetical protein JSV25_08045 [Spirochaetota bacterium]|nr:MAG: hypothetical protein JSV25_08045 [Spirochaetota bacterium]